MAKQNVFNGIVKAITIFFAILLLLSCAVPYISAENLSPLTFLSIGVPILVAVNVLFFLYWAFRKESYFLISLGVLGIGYFSMGTFFRFARNGVPIPKEDLSIMSYNILGFNKYHALDEAEVKDKIVNFVTAQDPDIVVFQEFDYRQTKHFTQYPHRFVNYIFRKESRVQQAIFSKYPIVSKGTLDFPDSSNNAIYVDVVYKKDTLRIYNVHLQSFQFIPSREFLAHEPSEKLVKRITTSFIKQQQQARLVNDHRKKSPYKTIVCGDFNSTQFSNAYRVIKEDMKDSFLEMGVGFGRTYSLRQLPYRIDFILADPSFEFTAHKNFDVKLSDHFPVMAAVRQRAQ